MKKVITEIGTFVGIGLVTISLLSFTPLDEFNHGWFSGILTVALANSLIWNNHA